MKKKTVIIIAAIVVVLAAAGVTAAVVVNNQDKKTDTQNNSSNSDSSNVDTAKTFAPKNLAELAYVASSTTTVAGQTVTSTIESDGKGTTKTSSTVAGMVSETYITGNDVVSCVDGTCSKTTVDPSTAPDTLAADTTKYRDSAKNAGSETIDGKTYQKWTITTEEAGEITYYIDDSNRVGRIVMSTATIVYDYKDVSITVPQV